MNPDDMLLQMKLLTLGFDVKAFEAWLTKLPNTPPKTAFRKTLAEVIAAVDEGRANEVTHLLEVIHFAWQADRHVEVLSPRARAELHRISAKKSKKETLHEWIRRHIRQHPDATAAERHNALPQELRYSKDYFSKQVGIVKKEQ